MKVKDLETRLEERDHDLRFGSDPALGRERDISMMASILSSIAKGENSLIEAKDLCRIFIERKKFI